MPVNRTRTEVELIGLARKLYAPGPDTHEYLSALWRLDLLNEADMGKVDNHRRWMAYTLKEEPEHAADGIPDRVRFDTLVFVVAEGERPEEFRSIGEYDTPSEAVRAGEVGTDMGASAHFVVMDTQRELLVFDSSNPYGDYISTSI